MLAALSAKMARPLRWTLLFVTAMRKPGNQVLVVVEILSTEVQRTFKCRLLTVKAGVRSSAVTST
jgi:hypothetical protein